MGRTLVRYDRPGCGLSDAVRRTADDGAGAGHDPAVTEAVGGALRPVRLVDGCGGRGAVGVGPARDGLAAGPVRRVGHRAAIGDDDSRRHVLGLLATTGGWDPTCSPTSSRRRPTRGPGGRWRSTSARPPRRRPRSRCSTGLRPGRTARARPDRRRRRWCCTGARTGRLRSPGPGARRAIPGAELVELEGRSHLPAFGDIGRGRRPGAPLPRLPQLRRAVPTGLTPARRRSRRWWPKA